jgi:hypothetical protein
MLCFLTWQELNENQPCSISKISEAFQRKCHSTYTRCFSMGCQDQTEGVNYFYDPQINVRQELGNLSLSLFGLALCH